MCGIIGIVGTANVTARLLEGLAKLEYRGYDSAGIAVLNGSGLKRRRTMGKVSHLRDSISVDPIDGSAGLGHTRWATHGKPSIENAHPHFAGKVSVVHNGIIENYEELREELSHCTFESQTDTEIIALLLNEELSSGKSSEEAFKSTLQKLEGAYALGVMIDDGNNEIFAARLGSPLAIGVGQGEMYLGSDAVALSELSRKIVYLEEGDWAVLTPDTYSVYTSDDQPVLRETKHLGIFETCSDKGVYDHFMLKEIFEQPNSTQKTINQYLLKNGEFTKQAKQVDFTNIDRVILVACGTAFYAGSVAKYWFESIAGIPVDIDIASEFRYRSPSLSRNSLFIAISQSGETADTLAALRYCKENGLQTAAVVNVPTSSMAREADIVFPIEVGPEIGVASTKAFTGQLAALCGLSLYAASVREQLPSKRFLSHFETLKSVPLSLKTALEHSDEIRKIAEKIVGFKSAFFLGRGPMAPMACEGALKLKEVSYIHAEGYAAGELKHGPIALIEKGTPVIVLAPFDELFEKTVSNMQEVAARGAEIHLFTDATGAAKAGHLAASVVSMPTVSQTASPIVQSIGVQLLAYHAAVLLGTDVDQPRNLAKSVTVE